MKFKYRFKCKKCGQNFRKWEKISPLTGAINYGSKKMCMECYFRLSKNGSYDRCKAFNETRWNAHDDKTMIWRCRIKKTKEVK